MVSQFPGDWLTSVNLLLKNAYLIALLVVCWNLLKGMIVAVQW